ncbi:UDP-2,3-diacylglucosamine diphosphatase [Marinoscillum furvescens]|uniref:UDP-2,3-diacylglucosamine hydrolase n=1 Tax=Marinoscillum furvescens DSM 4134 TaxID=1122208 RepID=A0A3D9L4D1_MARFU|nr:UDP-2,3-diacylglucosamine diphosphatase [Marinoscillum furvescens]RED99528.1 UDP-2,3-diacylglucosamine hydrolase [Marinoscillum furvescens DSM 4134]
MDSQFAQLADDQKVYLASDFHLGVPNQESSLKRERKIIRWLDTIAPDAAGIMLVGDVFDFWFEYRKVIPKGYVRFLGKLAELRDSGIPILLFAGNHDLWLADYFPEELDIPVLYRPTSFVIGPHRVHVGHGDGLGPGDRKFKFFKKIFVNPAAKWAFRWLHPDIGVAIAQTWSGSSKEREDEPFAGENERILQYARDVHSHTSHDAYVFGHRHLKLEMPIDEGATYYNLGEWMTDAPYLEISNEAIKLRSFES